MTDIYIVQSWGYKKTNLNDNDDVEILGVYQNLDNARQFVNNRFSYYLSDHHYDLVNHFFPRQPRKLIIKQYLKRKGLDSLTANKVLSYIYPIKNLIPVGANIPNGIWNDQMTLHLTMNLPNCYLRLMELQKWISSSDQTISFPEYGEISVQFNTEVYGIIRRMSHETCRIRLFDSIGKEIPITLYLGNNLIDLEDCPNKESHYCYSFRIYTKLLRD